MTIKVKITSTGECVTDLKVGETYFLEAGGYQMYFHSEDMHVIEYMHGLVQDGLRFEFIKEGN